jgi:cell division protein ZapA
MDGEEKKPVRLTIFNQTFTLRATDPERLLQAANEVDELMSAIAKSGNIDTSRAAILACLHLQDRIQSLESDLEKFRAIEERTKQLASLLDGVIG